MLKSKRKILVADLLCGAGGSSTGAARALAGLGLEMDLVCVNHWPVAIDTHSRNHPEARHYVQDISTVRPHMLVPEGYLDLLMASPTCTHHSVARGGKPTSDQQRSDPWHIITWLTELRVKRLIIENVWEFIGWGPVDPKTGRPIAERKGEYFHAWIETLRRLGFDPEWRKLNAADYGDATTRQRFILMARSDGRKVSWPMPTHRKRGADDGSLFAPSQTWRPAREIIDWNIKGKSIFGRKKDLAPKTMMRIYAGALKHGWPEPFIVILRNYMSARGVDLPLPTIAANGGHIGLAQPVMFANRNNNAPKAPSTDPVPCLTTAPGGGIMLAEPVIMNGRKGNQAKGVSTEPVPTLDTKGGVWLAEPQIEPFILNRHGDGYGEARAHSIEDPAPTANCDGGGYVVEPFILSQASGGAARAVGDPIPTAPTGGAHALISPYYGSGSGETCETTGEPLPTVTSKGRFGLVVPVTQSGGGATARDVLDPIPGANRGELAFIAAQFGEREGQAPRVHDIAEPAPTLCATGRVNLVSGEVDGRRYDILFRMLEPHELAAAMGFNTADSIYEFAGTKTEQIKQIGNAVSVAKMAACVSTLLADEAEPMFQEAAE